MSTGEVVGDLASDSSGAKAVRNVMGSGLWPTSEFPQDYEPMVHVTYQAGFHPVKAHETKTAKDLRRSKNGSQGLLVPEPVLKGKKSCAGVRQREQEVLKSIVSSSLKGYEDEVTWPNLRRFTR